MFVQVPDWYRCVSDMVRKDVLYYCLSTHLPRCYIDEYLYFSCHKINDDDDDDDDCCEF